MKKILITISIVLLFFLLLGLVYFLFIQKKTPSQTINPPQDVFRIESSARNTTTSPKDFVMNDTVQQQAQRDLVQIDDTPVAGAAFFSLASSTATSTQQVIRFIRKENGNLYQYNRDSGEKTRLSNTTFPGIIKTLWFDAPDKVALQYINKDNELETYLATLVDGGLSGTFLEKNISASTSYKNTLVTAVSDTQGTTVTTRGSDGNSAQDIIRTPLGQILIPKVTKKAVYILSKPVSAFPGVLYSYSRTSSKEERVVGDVLGLTALPNNDGSWILYSSSANRKLQTFALNTKTRESIPLPITTLPEKCVWGEEPFVIYCGVPNNLPDVTYPESWYQGKVSFTDSLWRTNLETRVTTAVSFFDNDGPFDITNMKFTDNTLLFINKRDGTLWMQRL